MNKINKFDPLENLVLDKDEREIEDALEKGEYERSLDSKEFENMFEEAARGYASLRGSKSITLRVKNKDLISIKARAKRNNIPYQKLINLLISNYAQGKSKIAV